MRWMDGWILEWIVLDCIAMAMDYGLKHQVELLT